MLPKPLIAFPKPVQARPLTNYLLMYGTTILQACFAMHGLFLLHSLATCPLHNRQEAASSLFSVSVAGFTDLWPVLQQASHNRTYAIHQDHKRLGPVVRVGTHHLSFSSVQAVKDFYGHGSPVTKAPFTMPLFPPTSTSLMRGSFLFTAKGFVVSLGPLRRRALCSLKLSLAYT